MWGERVDKQETTREVVSADRKGMTVDGRSSESGRVLEQGRVRRKRDR